MSYHNVTLEVETCCNFGYDLCDYTSGILFKKHIYYNDDANVCNFKTIAQTINTELECRHILLTKQSTPQNINRVYICAHLCVNFQ